MASAKTTYQKINKIKSLAKVTAGACVFFSGLSIYKGNEKFYSNYLMPAVRLLPPELSHSIAVQACKYKLVTGPNIEDAQNLNTKFFGHIISNPIGIAAGFDKQGVAIEGLHQLGFGFVEIGSVTPEPQPGNPTPRVFRLDADSAIINRYGFNSDGHKAVFDRLRALKDNAKFNGVIGVNLGKNKCSETPLLDYVKGVEVFGPIADYLVINISSPNTPGLRDLQGKKDLEKLLVGILNARKKLENHSNVPILLKISPDLSKQDIDDIAEVINKPTSRVDGLIISNTTVARENLKETNLATEAGGLSGAPLRLKSTQLIAAMFDKTNGKIPIIGVGGIASGQDAYEKIEAGASFLQFYTAFIYHGPPIVARIKSELSDILKKGGNNNLEEFVGKNYKKYLNE